MAYESQPIPDTTSVSDAISSRRGKLSTNFTFSANNRTVTVNDSDFIKFIYVLNVTRGAVLFQPALRDTSGVIVGNVLTLNVRTNGMSDSDDLVVVYEATELNSEELTDIGIALDNILLEALDQGLTLDSTLTELVEQGIVQDSELAELLAQGLTLDSTLTEILEQGVVQDGQAAEQLDQGITLDSMLAESIDQGITKDDLLTETRSMETWQDNLVKELKIQTKLLRKISN